MTKRISGTTHIIRWLLLAIVLGAAYVGGVIAVEWLVVLELCALALAVVVWILWRRVSEPPRIVEQILYEVEHPRRP